MGLRSAEVYPRGVLMYSFSHLPDITDTLPSHLQGPSLCCALTERSHPWPSAGQHVDDDRRMAPMQQEEEMQEAAGNTRGLEDQGSTTSQHSEQSSDPQWIQQHGMQEEAREAQHADGESTVRWAGNRRREMDKSSTICIESV